MRFNAPWRMTWFGIRWKRNIEYGDTDPSADGRLLLESARAREEIVAKLDVLCYQCNAVVAPQKLRVHVGAHILAHHYQMGIPKTQKPVGKHYPCGFCGREGCTLLLKASKSGKTPQASSDCPRFQLFQRLSALKPKECSNAHVRRKERLPRRRQLSSLISQK